MRDAPWLPSSKARCDVRRLGKSLAACGWGRITRLEFFMLSSITIRRRPSAIWPGIARPAITRATLRLVARFVAWLVLGIVVGWKVEISSRNRRRQGE
jgi:hypothetical protein